jgi:UDP-N-acetylglucosamine 2-epimerase (non-hydrolysing)
VKNLSTEGITNGVYLVGDVMSDALTYNRGIAQRKSHILETLDFANKGHCVLTVHRAGNTDNQQNLTSIIRAVGMAGVPVVFPVHPRTRKYLQKYHLLASLPENIHLIDPLGYLDMIRLMESAMKILTDSGGIQKEAYLLGVPCITLRENTEWVETIEAGWNVLVGADTARILSAIHAALPTVPQRNLYPPGAARKISDILKRGG